jgi:hypothetical protein
VSAGAVSGWESGSDWRLEGAIESVHVGYIYDEDGAGVEDVCAFVVKEIFLSWYEADKTCQARIAVTLGSQWFVSGVLKMPSFAL